MTHEHLEQWSSGEGLKSYLGRLNAVVSRSVNINGDGFINVDQANGTVSLWLDRDQLADEVAVTQVAPFRYKSMGDDYIECRSFTLGVEGDDAVYLAKPYKLRRSPFESASFVYTDGETRSVNSEDQIIVPAYAADDVIMGIRTSVIGTGIELPTKKVHGFNEPVPINWLDMNNDGRAWAEDV